jgi:four helix bundle protein
MSFRDLRVYQAAFALQQRIFKTTKSFPREEIYSLTDQFRRASRSNGANISEAWQKRRYQASFVSKLSDSDGEQAETQHWIGTALACDYISQAECDGMLAQCMEIGRMLGSMMAAPEKFCQVQPPPAARRLSSVLRPLPPSLPPRQSSVVRHPSSAAPSSP